MDEQLVDLLVCPVCHGALVWRTQVRVGGRIEEGEARCHGCGATYPVHEGIGLFLTPDLSRHDLWEEVESRLAAYLRQHLEVERTLLATPLEGLSPADRWFRARILEERGAFAEAQRAEELALADLYTREWLACYRAQLAYVTEHLSPAEGPVVDLASGRGRLVEELARRSSRPIVATDFSPRVLRAARRRFAFLGLARRVSFLACDARRTPFRDQAVGTMTTNLGLANIEQPEGLLPELRRVVAGELLAICHFFPEEDEANAAAIRRLGLATFLYERPTVAAFRGAGFEVELTNVRRGQARPTPEGVLLAGAGTDALPVAETELTWCTLIAR